MERRLQQSRGLRLRLALFQATPQKRWINALRIAYAFAAVACAVVGWTMLSGGVLRLFTAFAPELEQTIDPHFVRAAALPLALLIALCLFLALRPYWWGKILAFWAGLSWTGFGLVAYSFGGEGLTPALATMSGVTMLIVGIAHQLIDPRWSGVYLRAADPTATEVR